jgi:hypothetical protein
MAVTPILSSPRASFWSRSCVAGKMADEEEVPDQKAVHDERCAKTTECAMLYVQYEACAKRVEAKGHGECTGYYMDYLGAIDRCVRHARLRACPSQSARVLSRSASCAGEGGDLCGDQVRRQPHAAHTHRHTHHTHTMPARTLERSCGGGWPIAAPRAGLASFDGAHAFLQLNAAQA